MYLLKHGHLIIDGNREYLDGAILVDDDRIVEVFAQTDKIKDLSYQYEEIDLNNQVVMPGYFDSHTHGSSGICFDDASIEDLEVVSKDFAKDGSTNFLVTLSYDLDKDNFLKQLKVLNEYESKYSFYHGVHLEGPFLSKKRLGVATGDTFIEPNLELVKEFIDACSKIRQMTIAYELDGAKQIGSFLKQNNIKVMCGHSEATYDDLDENVDGITHLFNAMPSLHHREMNLVNCAFENKWYCELIADGKHIMPSVLRLAINNIDKDKIMLVSDSSSARNLPDGEYTFMSKKCIKKDGTFISEDNHFAGSVASINDEIKVLYSLGAKYTDLLLYSSLNAFKFYGLAKEFGTIEKGKYANLVISDDELNIKNVMLKGKFIYV